MRPVFAALALILMAQSGVAQSPDQPLRPVARGDFDVIPQMRPTARPDQGADVVTQAQLAVLSVPKRRPALRPISEQAQREAEQMEQIAYSGPVISERPWVRPDSITEQALAKRRMRRKGAVCGDLDIQGEEVGYVPGRIKACGIKDAVKLRAVAGVSLSQQSLVNCATARAIKKWVEKGVQPAFRGNKVVTLKVAAHYSCRTRNNRPGARISEHGKGNAIDISGFVLRDGKVVTVLNDWGRVKALRKVHRAACGTFGTVLGPHADRYHKDHFHFDIARHRGGPYCR